MSPTGILLKSAVRTQVSSEGRAEQGRISLEGTQTHAHNSLSSCPRGKV